ncbi:MAG: sugar-binding protein, partial [Sphingobacteriales bacterium]
VTTPAASASFAAHVNFTAGSAPAMIASADMNGDGLTDLVRIRNGEVCYWPNMGYGKFAPKVTMTFSPYFDEPGLFNPMYLSLTDISGTGAADLIYVSRSACRIWTNLSGNGWSTNPVSFNLPTVEPYSKIAVLDLLGSGTGCIVWSSPLPQHSNFPLRYIDLMGGQKPFLMNTFSNGMGKKTELSYKSSCQYFLEDRAAQKQWATRLPFPVQCLQQTKVSDVLSGTSYTQSYSYHHGYYDHAEREFRGFGMVETMDSEAAVAGESDILNQAPVLTKTWFHTGAWTRQGTLLQAYSQEYFPISGYNLPEGAYIPNDLGAEETREAIRCLKGSPLRQEVYALDGSSLQDKPYTVTLSSYRVVTVQER